MALSPRPISTHRILLITVLLILTTLLLWQYFLNRSVWVDEAMLSLNIIEKDYPALLKPLDYIQVAPILFLFIEKTSTYLFGNSELALRLFPLCCAIVSLPVFYYLCVTLTRNRIIAIVAVCLLGLTPKFIYYASEIKQYSVDLLVLLAIYYFALAETPTLQRRRTLLLSLTAGISIFLSNISVVPLCTVGLLFLYRSWRERRLKWGLLFPILVGVVCFGINYFLFIRNHPSTGIMKAFWKNAFMPIDPFHVEFRQWMARTVRQLFEQLLPFFVIQKLYFLTIVVYLGSILHMLYAKKYLLLYCCLGPIVIHMGLSALQLYPFELRLVLYQTPLYLLTIAYGLTVLVNLVTTAPVLRYGVLGLLVLLFSVRLVHEYPIYSEEIRPVISHINQKIQPGQKIYVYYASIPAMRFYKETGFTHFGNDSFLLGRSRVADYITDGGAYVDELRDWKGPTWLIFSHVYPFDGSHGEESYIVGKLIQRGALLDRFRAPGSSAYLVDLK